MIMAAITLACGLATAAILPREKNFVRSEGLVTSARQMVGHLANPHLLAIYAVGFGVLFNFVALFTYVVFLLAAPPYNLSPTLLGAIFVTYLVGAVAVLGFGRAVARFGRRTLILGTVSVWGLRCADHACAVDRCDHSGARDSGRLWVYRAGNVNRFCRSCCRKRPRFRRLHLRDLLLCGR